MESSTPSVVRMPPDHTSDVGVTSIQQFINVDCYVSFLRGSFYSSTQLRCTLGEDGGSRAISFDSVERYDPSRDKWSLITPMKVPRCQVGAAVLEGMLFAVGGYNDLTNFGFTSSVEM
eukprot:COSAG02_NODE_4471_length_5328_cov_3.132721_3_plen_118_part_00